MPGLTKCPRMKVVSNAYFQFAGLGLYTGVCVCVGGGQSEVSKDEKCLRVMKDLAMILAVT